jgi:hypothetical protein
MTHDMIAHYYMQSACPALDCAEHLTSSRMNESYQVRHTMVGIGSASYCWLIIACGCQAVAVSALADCKR